MAESMGVGRVSIHGRCHWRIKLNNDLIYDNDDEKFKFHVMSYKGRGRIKCPLITFTCMCWTGQLGTLLSAMMEHNLKLLVAVKKLQAIITLLPS